MRKVTLGACFLLSACTTVPELDRPNPDYVVKFDSLAFNNAPTLISEFQASNKLLLVAVTNKEQAQKASKDLQSVINAFDDDKDIYVAYRLTNLPSEFRLVEVFDASDSDIPKLVNDLRHKSVDEFGRFFSESEMRRFEADVYNKSIALTSYTTLQSQLAALLKSFGWTLLDFGAFQNSNFITYLPVDVELTATTLEPMATKDEVSEVNEITRIFKEN